MIDVAKSCCISEGLVVYNTPLSLEQGKSIAGFLIIYHLKDGVSSRYRPVILGLSIGSIACERKNLKVNANGSLSIKT